MAFDYTNTRIERLLARMEPRFRTSFLAIVRAIQVNTNLEDLVFLIERGQVDVALATLARQANKLSIVWNEGFTLAAKDSSEFLNGIGEIIIDYDQTNFSAVRIMQSNRMRLVREFTEQQRMATREAIVDGIRRGANPIEQARAFRDSIGLAPSQQRAVNNFRTALEKGNTSALSRQLRDKRFDSTVRRAAKEGRALSSSQIEKMTSRYRDRMLKYRSEVIARTESLRSVHEGNKEMFDQAIQSGDLDPNQVIQIWNTASDQKVRDTHKPMNGQERMIGVPFNSGDGSVLRYPGDASAPADETIQCRCALGTRILSLEEVASFQITAIG